MGMYRKLPANRCLTLGAMVTALTVLSLYAASILPVGRIPLYFLSAVFVYILAGEKAYGFALLTYLASSLLAFFLLPDKLPAYLYILLLGHYGIFRSAVQEKINGRLLLWLVKILYCNLFLGLGLYLSFVLLSGIQLEGLLAQMPVWVPVVLLQAAIILFDILYGASALIYRNHIRKAMIPRR